MKRSKKLIVLLVAVSMFISMFSGVIAEAAETGADTDTVVSEAELLGKKTCTIKKKDGKYYYVNTKSKTDKKQGWKKNKDEDYTYYVGKNGYVTVKIAHENYYKWSDSDKEFKKVSLKKKKYKGKTVTIQKKAFYVDKNGKIVQETGWKKKSGKRTYYVGKNGTVQIDTTIKIGGYQTVFDKNGKKVELKVEGGKIVRSDTGKAVNKKGVYQVGSGNSQKTYYCSNKNGKTDKTKGWKKDANGKYTYYVNANGVVSDEITKDGDYYKWNGAGREKQSLKKNSIKKIQKKAFYVNKNGKIVREPGWKKNTYYVGKNGTVQIDTTIKIGGYQTVFDKNGKKVELKVEGGKIVRSDTGEAVSKAGNYKVGSGISQKTYTVTASGKVKKYNNGKQEDGNQGNGKDDTQSDHVHRWQYTNTVSSKEHPAETHREYTKIRDAYDEPVYAERAVCKKCGAQFVTADDWGIHSDETNHGNFEYAHVIIGYNHIEAKYDWVEEVDKEAWSEGTSIYTCTQCGDTMTCYWSKESGSTEIHIAEKSGILVDIYGNPVDYGDGVVTIIAGVPF